MKTEKLNGDPAIVVREKTTTIATTTTSETDARAAAIRADIDRTRADMSGTIRQIEERLSPAHLKEQVLEQFHDAKEKVKTEVRHELDGAKEMVRNEIREAKHAVRDATIGRVENMVDSAKNTINEGSQSIVDTVRANPIPALLAGVGLAWLFMSARKGGGDRGRRIEVSTGRGGDYYGSRGYAMGARYGEDYRTYADRDRGESMIDQGRHAVGQAMHRAGDAAGNAARYVRDAAGNFVDHAGDVWNEAGEKIGNVAHQASDKASQLAHQVGDATSHFVHDAGDRAAMIARGARDQAMRIEGGAETMYRDNPLAAGAAAFAIGAAVGLSLPHTAKEDEWMGETRDRLVGQAAHMASDAVGVVKQKAQGLVDEIGKDGAKDNKSLPNGNSDKSTRV